MCRLRKFRYSKFMVRTLFEKIWDAHLVAQPAGRSPILYIDLHLVHEVTSPQAFDGLRAAGRQVRQPSRTVATVDHNIPTEPRGTPITDLIAAKQIAALQANCKEFGIRLFDMDSAEQGIVHVIGPELGMTQPGMTIVCGDSHTSTHGAFGALAFGIGTSEVEHVLATQCLAQQKPKTMQIDVRGQLADGRDGERSGAGDYWADRNRWRYGICDRVRGSGRPRAFDGRAHDALQHEHRGGRAGGDGCARRNDHCIREGTPLCSDGRGVGEGGRYWRSLPSDSGASSTKSSRSMPRSLCPFVTWGTNPGMVAPVTGRVPEMKGLEEAIAVRPNWPCSIWRLSRASGSRTLPWIACSSGRARIRGMEDLRAAARVAKGHHVSSKVRAMVVPGSQAVKRAAEQEGLHRIFQDAGFEWRESGCSMCLGMNPDILQPGERCASTSNRNFEGRQGRGGRTHLVSPMMAAAAAIAGHFTDIRNWKFE